MGTKIHNIKSKRVKNIHQMSFTDKVAMMAGCSSRMVRYILDEKKNQETELAQRILIAAAIIEERENRLMEEVKRIIKF